MTFKTSFKLWVDFPGSAAVLRSRFAPFSCVNVGFLLMSLLMLTLLTACDLSTQSTSIPTPTPDAVALVEGTRQAIDRLTPENNTPTPSATPVPQDTPTPFEFSLMPTPTSICEAAPRTRLILQERGQVLDDDPRALRMRSAPGTDSDIVAQIPINAVFLVLQGPTCAEKYAWYFVRYRDDEGWIAEGDEEQYYVQPYLPG